MRRAGIVIAAAAAALALLAGSAQAEGYPRTASDNVVVGNAGPLLLSAGGSPTRVALGHAEYVATRDGGIVGRGRYTVRVVRDGRTTTYWERTPCVDTGAIRPGDLVRIQVVRGVVATGSDHGCP